MKKYIGYIASYYLGISLNIFSGLYINNWKFWAILIPVIVMFTIDKFENGFGGKRN
jgi:hypothetical protein|nr:MAG TPA: hypothetical protein [Caudoviricetes sp.]